jgi:hypothetical protein
VRQVCWGPLIRASTFIIEVHKNTTLEMNKGSNRGVYQGVAAWVSKITTGRFPLGIHTPSSAGSLLSQQRFMCWADAES